MLMMKETSTRRRAFDVKRGKGGKAREVMLSPKLSDRLPGLLRRCEALSYLFDGADDR
jgi:hypothetical protein